MTRRGGSGARDDGFTLIELLVVVAIVGIIVAIAIPALQFALDRSKQRATLSDMRQLGNALMQYYLDNSYYPNGSLTASALLPHLVMYGGGPYPSQDRWGHDYGYSSDQKYYYSLESFGADGLDGAEIDYGTRNDFDLDLLHATGQFSASPEP